MYLKLISFIATGIVCAREAQGEALLMKGKVTLDGEDFMTFKCKFIISWSRARKLLGVVSEIFINPLFLAPKSSARLR
jgi:hypothetical protein